MDALRRRVLTYGGYDELWSDDYRLRIRYHRPREYYLRLVNGVWEPEDTVHPFMAQYLLNIFPTQNNSSASHLLVE